MREEWIRGNRHLPWMGRLVAGSLSKRLTKTVLSCIVCYYQQERIQMNKNIVKLVKSITATTNGEGFWSTEKRLVNIKSIEIDSITDDNGEEIEVGDNRTPAAIMWLRVYFNRKDWNVEKHGLIYTDTKWIAQLRKGLREIGLTAADLDYTEQGMQGDDYVSLHAWKPKTIAAFRKAFN